MKILESAENYLEAILMIRNEKGSVRSIDIVHELNFTKPSVSIAMKRLRENGYILIDDQGYITLTETGHDIASKVYDRHTTLTEALCLLGVPEEIAKADACKVEHHISQETFEKIKEHMQMNKGKH